MANIKTRYMGIELKSPVIAGASNIVTNTENLKRIEKAGAGAVVYKSLFEEQVQLESLELFERQTEYDDRHAEMIRIHPDQNPGVPEIQNHLTALKKARQTLSIPLFASINAVYNETWVDYAVKIQETGVDGLELNFYMAPEKNDERFEETENRQISIFRDVKTAVTIPVSVKLSPYYSNPIKLISDLDDAGADGFVLFNKLFQPDIDIRSESHFFPYSLSHREDNRLSLRFAGLLYGNTKGSVCTNSGIIDGTDVIKMILAGADSVQVVSTLYLNQIEVITKINSDLEKWMDSKGYETLDSFRGKLSKKNIDNKLPYHRAQYMDFMKTTTEILKKYKVIN